VADDEERRRELAASLEAVRARVAKACAAAGREPTAVTLVAVTKTYPASDVEHLAALGVLDIGENRDQEAAAKADQVTAPVRWHFVGQLQRNKARSVSTYAHLVHTVDSVRLADALADGARRHGRTLDVLVQVSIDGDPARGGAAGEELDRVLANVVDADGLALRGLMAIAPLDWEPDRAFAELAVTVERTRMAYPQATLLSAGMSGDLESAIRYGATHVRVGTALLGNRPPLM
jgi:pyridoxal phosphate enzyme (YggS family)